MKETRCKKRGLIGAAVAVMFFFASWFAVLFFRDVGKTMSVLPPAPEVGAGTRRMRVRAVAGNEMRSGSERERRGPRVADAPAAVRIVVGLDPGTAGRYVPRSRALASLGRDLAREETDALLDYLLSPDGTMRPERVAALKNDVWNLLRNQTVVPPDLIPVTAAVFRDPAQPPAVRDYALQHLGVMLERPLRRAERGDILECLREAAGQDAAPWSGTALIALSRMPDADAEDRAFLRSRAVTVAVASHSHPAARVTAVQIAAEQGCRDILPTARALAYDRDAAVPLRLASLAALRRLGDASDHAALRALAATNADERLSAALPQPNKTD